MQIRKENFVNVSFEIVLRQSLFLDGVGYPGNLMIVFDTD